MKTTTVLLLVVLILGVSCSSTSLTGRWKASKMYDLFLEDWKPVQQDISIEFSSESRFKTSESGRLTQGTYVLDTVAKPNRIVFDDARMGRVNAIYRVEGNKLTVKVSRDDTSQFPNDFEPDKGGGFELAEFERQQ